MLIDMACLEVALEAEPSPLQYCKTHVNQPVLNGFFFFFLPPSKNPQTPLIFKRKNPGHVNDANGHECLTITMHKVTLLNKSLKVHPLY